MEICDDLCLCAVWAPPHNSIQAILYRSQFLAVWIHQYGDLPRFRYYNCVMTMFGNEWKVLDFCNFIKIPKNAENPRKLNVLTIYPYFLGLVLPCQGQYYNLESGIMKQPSTVSYLAEVELEFTTWAWVQVTARMAIGGGHHCRSLFWQWLFSHPSFAYINKQ